MSIIALAAGIAALVLALASVLPLMGMCFGPVSGLFALVAFITGLASVVRTTLNREIEGRPQAFAGLFLSLVWATAATLLFLFASRH
jgi:ABC-type Na+ efflux pump permease subunit